MPDDNRDADLDASFEFNTQSPADGMTGISEPEDPMAISRVETSEARIGCDVPDPSAEVQELSRRLQEQVAQNAKLDVELRYLLEDLAVRKEFITELERELESIHTFAGRQLELTAEFEAYRRRFSHRIVDRIVDVIHRLPWLYRPLRRLSRVASNIASGSPTRAPDLRSANHRTGDMGYPDPPTSNPSTTQ